MDRKTSESQTNEYMWECVGTACFLFLGSSHVTFMGDDTVFLSFDLP